MEYFGFKLLAGGALSSPKLGGGSPFLCSTNWGNLILTNISGILKKPKQKWKKVLHTLGPDDKTALLSARLPSKNSYSEGGGRLLLGACLLALKAHGA